MLKDSSSYIIITKARGINRVERLSFRVGKKNPKISAHNYFGIRLNWINKTTFKNAYMFQGSFTFFGKSLLY